MESDSRALGISGMDAGHLRSFLKEAEGRGKRRDDFCQHRVFAQSWTGHNHALQEQNVPSGLRSKARRDRVVLGWRGFGARGRVLRP